MFEYRTKETRSDIMNTQNTEGIAKVGVLCDQITLKTISPRNRANMGTHTNRQTMNARSTDGRILRCTFMDSKLLKLSFIVFIAIFFCVAGILNITAKGSEKPVEKQYKSIQIAEGDTLWSIALKYNDTTISKNSTEDYIEDIMSINNLARNDKITAGNYIIVPLYIWDE